MISRALMAFVIGLVLAACGPHAAGTDQTPEASSSAQSSPEESQAAAESPTAPPTPRTTPPGTPAPAPDEPVTESTEIATPSPVARQRPTPEPETGLWRIQGYIVDDEGQPLESVCVVIGPLGCTPGSLRTDERGHWFVDVAAGANTRFTFTFQMPGHETKWWQVRPEGPIEFNVVLRRS